MRRQKATFADLNKMGADFHTWQSFRTTDGKSGCRYILDNPLTDEQKDHLAQFKNVGFGEAYYRHAPQIKYNAVILFDKKIK